MALQDRARLRAVSRGSAARQPRSPSSEIYACRRAGGDGKGALGAASSRLTATRLPTCARARERSHASTDRSIPGVLVCILVGDAGLLVGLGPGHVLVGKGAPADRVGAEARAQRDDEHDGVHLSAGLHSSPTCTASTATACNSKLSSNCAPHVLPASMRTSTAQCRIASSQQPHSGRPARIKARCCSLSKEHADTCKHDSAWIATESDAVSLSARAAFLFTCKLPAGRARNSSETTVRGLATPQHYCTDDSLQRCPKNSLQTLHIRAIPAPKLQGQLQKPRSLLPIPWK